MWHNIVSECWDGRISDKNLTYKSTFLSLLEPGDIVLANRGFTVSEDIALQSASNFHFLPISEKLKANWPKGTLILKHKCCCVRCIQGG